MKGIMSKQITIKVLGSGRNVGATTLSRAIANTLTAWGLTGVLINGGPDFSEDRDDVYVESTPGNLALLREHLPATRVIASKS